MLTLIKCVPLSPAPCHAPSWFDGSHALTTPKTLEDLVSMLWMKQLHVLREPEEDKINGARVKTLTIGDERGLIATPTIFKLHIAQSPFP